MFRRYIFNEHILNIEPIKKDCVNAFFWTVCVLKVLLKLVTHLAYILYKAAIISLFSHEQHFQCKWHRAKQSDDTINGQTNQNSFWNTDLNTDT